MENELLEAMKKRVRILPMELTESDIVVGKIAFYHDTSISPLSENGWIFCHIEEILLRCSREFGGINFKTSYLVKSKQGLVNDGYEYCLKEMIATNSIVLECKRGGEFELKASKRSKKIYWLSYTKEYLEKGVNLTLFYLEEFGFEWVESFKDDILSYTLIRNT